MDVTAAPGSDVEPGDGAQLDLGEQARGLGGVGAVRVLGEELAVGERGALLARGGEAEGLQQGLRLGGLAGVGELFQEALVREDGVRPEQRQVSGLDRAFDGKAMDARERDAGEVADEEERRGYQRGEHERAMSRHVAPADGEVAADERNNGRERNQKIACPAENAGARCGGVVAGGISAGEEAGGHEGEGGKSGKVVILLPA